MIALFQPAVRTYFLRKAISFYDGRVKRLRWMDVSCHEVGKDAFGKPLERQGEQYEFYAQCSENSNDDELAAMPIGWRYASAGWTTSCLSLKPEPPGAGGRHR